MAFFFSRPSFILLTWLKWRESKEIVRVCVTSLGKHFLTSFSHVLFLGRNCSTSWHYWTLLISAFWSWMWVLLSSAMTYNCCKCAFSKNLKWELVSKWGEPSCKGAVFECSCCTAVLFSFILIMIPYKMKYWWRVYFGGLVDWCAIH